MKKTVIIISTFFLFSAFVSVSIADLYTKNQITKFSEVLL